MEYGGEEIPKIDEVLKSLGNDILLYVANKPYLKYTWNGTVVNVRMFTQQRYVMDNGIVITRPRIGLLPTPGKKINMITNPDDFYYHVLYIYQNSENMNKYSPQFSISQLISAICKEDLECTDFFSQCAIDIKKRMFLSNNDFNLCVQFLYDIAGLDKDAYNKQEEPHKQICESDRRDFAQPIVDYFLNILL